MLILLFKASHFGIKNLSQSNVFPRHLPGHPVLRFYVYFIENARFCDPFKIQWVQKSADTGRCQVCQTSECNVKLK